MAKCARRCGRTTDHVSGYCSDTCLQLDHNYDGPPVTVLARNKQGGFGRGLAWMTRQPVPVTEAGESR